MEEIVKAGIRYKDEIYTGFEHGQCFTQLPQEHKDSEIEQGFITNEGKFVDRKEAMKIARNAGQITYDLGKETLISEDLHLYWLNKLDNQVKELEAVIKQHENKLDKSFWYNEYNLKRKENGRLYTKIQDLMKSNEQLDTQLNMFVKLSDEMGKATEKINKVLPNPYSRIDNYTDWSEYVSNQLKEYSKIRKE